MRWRAFFIAFNKAVDLSAKLLSTINKFGRLYFIALYLVEILFRFKDVLKLRPIDI